MFTNQSEPQCSVQALSLLTAWLCIYSSFIPLFIFVLFVGFQQIRSKTSATSNFDVFTVNITIMEILSITGAYLFYSGYFSKKPHIQSTGEIVNFVAVMGQTVFHDLTCADRYLAVVHPITYLRLKKRGGVIVRNISIGCTWVVSIVLMTVVYFTGSITSKIVVFTLLPIGSILIVCFCTASVLCVLIRPRPGEVGGDRRGLDQSKRKAFNTMLTTLGALLSKFISILLSYILGLSSVLSTEIACVVLMCTIWLSLPSSLMVPLIFLNRAGKLPKWK